MKYSILSLITLNFVKSSGKSEGHIVDPHILMPSLSLDSLIEFTHHALALWSERRER